MKITTLNVIFLVMIIFACDSSQASWFIDGDKYNSSVHAQLSCLDCHSNIIKDPDHPLVEDVKNSLNDFLNNEQCIDCHQQVLESFEPGEPGNFRKIGKAASGPCASCHTPHHEKIAHDAHIGIPCVSCHMANVKPLRIMDGTRQIWVYNVDINKEYDPHLMISEKNDICSRCHFKNNGLGVPDHMPPAKSFICMPCHTSTLSMGGIPSTAAFVIFLAGILSIFITWMSAGRRESGRKRLTFTGWLSVFKELILDGLLQRSLLKVSFRRWAVHAIIFFPLMFRFLFGITALVLSIYRPEWNLTRSMLDKNNPGTGFLYDVTGILILAGGCLMILEKRSNRLLNGIRSLPRSNIFIHVLLGGMIISGFIVEGVRISMTGSPEGSEFAFIGYGISRLLTGFNLTGIYIYFWYAHAVITGAFVAFLPFSRMFHVFVAPLSVIIRAASGK